MSAPCLVRLNTRARSTSSRLMIEREQEALFRLVDEGHRSGRSARPWSPPGSPQPGRILQETVGKLADRLAAWSPRRTGSGGLRDNLPTIHFSAWMKPRSSIWSASSRTRISTASRLIARWSTRSTRRPGVATRMSSAARHCPLVLVDRGAAEDGHDMQTRCCAHSRSRSRRSALASSRVGASTSMRQRPPCGRLAEATRRSIDGSMNAAVLPVPVWAMPSRSRPDKHGRDRLRLDRRRHDVIFRRERVEEGLREPEVE